jgi:hypothetical protein
MTVNPAALPAAMAIQCCCLGVTLSMLELNMPLDMAVAAALPACTAVSCDAMHAAATIFAVADVATETVP